MIRRSAALVGLVLLAASCDAPAEVRLRTMCLQRGGFWLLATRDVFPPEPLQKQTFLPQCFVPLDPITGEISVLDSLGNFAVVTKRELHVGKPSEKQ
jgi:hypothetical protein